MVLASQSILAPDARARLRAFPAITLEEIRSRIYPFGGLGASIVGHYRSGDGQGASVTTGLEHSLSLYLAGEPGKAMRIESAKRDEPLGNIVLEEARHGHSLVLTVDTDLQLIAETQLARSVKDLEARGGAVLIIDPSCGDILAAASWPVLPDRSAARHDPAVWNNFNFTGQYEPGSVFKVFTAASLLSHGAIDTATVYDCGDEDFGKFSIHNSDGHAFAHLNFMEAFEQSCNVYFARAVANLSADEFYRDLTEFGFGQRVRLPYQAQAPGILNPPAVWSGRSQATIAIGQEIAVTPLQLGMAVGAVANGGTLYAPRLVREIRGADGRLVETCPAIPLRRVISEPLSALLRQAMARAVQVGTGEAANLSWIQCGGKTGTAQKSLDGLSYARGKYMASFIGCVPIDQPRLVILTILDEPPGLYHYAAQSAVPLFRDIVVQIRRNTDWLTDVASQDPVSASVSPDYEWVAIPDVMYLSSTLAEAEMMRVGLKLWGGDKEGQVVEQVPAAGVRVPRGSRVGITVAAQRPPATQAGLICPDFMGLSNREVRSLAARMGVQVQIEGVGYVSRQSPLAGSILQSPEIRVRMESPWL